MTTRKIFNYESKVLIEETIDKYGYDPCKLGRTSRKFVVAICRYCGKPHDIRMGFFNKSGSACHRECKIEEMKKQKSPFKDPKVRKKAKQTVRERYGVDYASQNKDIAKQISKSRSSKVNQDKVKKTNIKKYGVENSFQSEEIKKKISETNFKRYGVESPQKNTDIQRRTKNTNIKKYGVENPLSSGDVRAKIEQTNLDKYGFKNPQQLEHIQKKTRKTFHKTVKKNKNGHYKMINFLRKSKFWKYIEDHTIQEACEKFDLEYYSLTAALSRPEFKDKFHSIYSFPTQQLQKEIYDWLMNEGANVSFNDRSVISPLELDIVDHDKKVALEFNGSYWHSEAILARKEARIKHSKKTRLCRERGYRLIHIFEHTYLTRKQQVQNYIRSAFGLNKTKIAGRKCKISNTNADFFIDMYHIQGKPTGTIRYFNLVYDDEIVGCMTAGKHHERGGDTNACILTRLVFKDNITVQGGASKLFSAFKKWAKKEGYDQIISWSDNAISEGNVYHKMGFYLDKNYSPSYFYYDIKTKSYKTKQSQRLSNKERPDGMSIKDWNNSLGMYVIWDCGKKKWVFFLTPPVKYKDENILQLIDTIKSNLDFDLIEEKYKGPTPIHGACYVASEALYHLLGGKDVGLVVKHYKLQNGIVHWWLEKDGKIIDITAEQYDFRIPYELGKKASFLTKKPSKRCLKLLNRMK